MFIITDQASLGVGTESCFSSARQSEKESGITLLDSFVATRVQRKDSEVRHPVVHHSEEPLLHLSGILRAQDDRRSSRHVQSDACSRTRAFVSAILLVVPMLAENSPAL